MSLTHTLIRSFIIIIIIIINLLCFYTLCFQRMIICGFGATNWPDKANAST